MGRGNAPVPAERVYAIDWLRGLSVIFMIECHSLVFLSPSLEYTRFWMNLQNVNGLVSTAFLFASGFAGGLVGSRAAKDAAARQRRTRRTFLRLAGVVAIAIYFHVCCYPVFSRPVTLLRVDILTCIAYGSVAVWAITNAARGRHALAFGTLLAAAIAILIATPWASRYRGGEALTCLLNNTEYGGVAGSMFPLLPWLVYPLLGGAAGVLTAHPTAGRSRLMTALGSMVVVSGLLSLPTTAALWNHFDPDSGIFWVSNCFERLWKLGMICLALMAIERLSIAVVGNPVTRLFRPVKLTVDYFSRHALTGYFVHLSLIYGFLGFSFTKTWQHHSTWGQYSWRMVAMVALTAAVCHAGRRLRMGVQGELRKYFASDAAPLMP